MKETAHTFAILPESSQKIMTFPKRDVVNATKGQKEQLGKTKRERAIVSELTSSSENEEQAKTRKKQKEKARTPELAFDYEEETRSSTIEISSNTTEAGEERKEVAKPNQAFEKEEWKEYYTKNAHIP